MEGSESHWQTYLGSGISQIDGSFKGIRCAAIRSEEITTPKRADVSSVIRQRYGLFGA
jgi:hypothetical protein